MGRAENQMTKISRYVEYKIAVAGLCLAQASEINLLSRG